MKSIYFLLIVLLCIGCDSSNKSKRNTTSGPPATEASVASSDSTSEKAEDPSVFSGVIDAVSNKFLLLQASLFGTPSQQTADPLLLQTIDSLLENSTILKPLSESEIEALSTDVSVAEPTADFIESLDPLFLPTTSNSLQAAQNILPQGSDTLSASTNQRRATESRRIRGNAVAGAAFVMVPDVNHYGVVSMEYELDIPSGRAGIQPNLSLKYASSGGDSWLGVGWVLGMGSISRSTQYGQVHYDGRDVFLYNGKRLIKTSGPDDSEDGVYRLEIESNFSRFELSNSDSGGVWVIKDREGVQTTYGADFSSRIYPPEDSSKTFRWHFSQSEDLNGNIMLVSYDESFYETNNMLYLKEIRYTGNTSEDFPARQYVRFSTKPRPTQPYITKAPGFIMKLDRVLDHIEIGWDDNKLWEYQLIYENSPDSQKPLLKTVNSARTSTQPEFKYHSGGHALQWQRQKNPYANDPEVDLSHTQYFEGDFNGDGISDIVVFNPQTGEWKAMERLFDGSYRFRGYANHFKGYDSAERIQWFPNHFTGDFNGDGRSDIPFYLPETKTFWVAEHNGDTFEFKSYGRQSLVDLDFSKVTWFNGDFDGNGLIDGVVFDEPTGDWIYMRNVGGRFEFLRLSKQFQHLFRSDYAPNHQNNSLTTLDTSFYGEDRTKLRFFTGDFNGDRRTDISFYDARSASWFVGENHRNDDIGFHLQWELYQTFSVGDGALFAQYQFTGDFNGDGFSDFLLFDQEASQWILGVVGDRAVSFRRYATLPQFKEITRWIQGDFNGDGRSDVGFYSKTDNNFWIGEATGEGFNYRIYNTLAGGGADAQRIMQTPLPKDQIVLQTQEAVITTSNATKIIQYPYNLPPYPDRGEQVFAGCFTTTNCFDNPELLIYDRGDKQFHLKRDDQRTENVLSSPLDVSNITWLSGARPGAYLSNRSELLYYEVSQQLTNRTHQFQVLQHQSNQQFQINTLATFNDQSIVNFEIESSAYLVDYFTSTTEQSLLILDDQAETPRFVHIEASNETAFSIEGDLEASDFHEIFQLAPSNPERTLRPALRFFSGIFDNATTPQVLLLNQLVSPAQWYLGTLDTTQHTITFQQLSGDITFAAPPTDFSLSKNAAGLEYQTSADGSLLYASTTAEAIQFHQLRIVNGQLLQTSSTPLGGTWRFEGDKTHEGHPLVRSKDSWKIWNTTTLRWTDLDNTIAQEQIKRPELVDHIYPFRWMQGDYNGDSKTDLAFIHLKEPQWYFLHSEGDIPDLIKTVHNGIGGTYSFEYTNSTTFDNTGNDDIPDLPSNQRVCILLSMDDGFGRLLKTKYEYRDGFAFTDFIAGRRERDHYGFGEFRIIDAHGGVTIRKYHSTPNRNYLENRALGGVLRENIQVGEDGKVYSRQVYEYKIHQIQENPSQTQPSYLAEEIRVQRFFEEALIETNESLLTLAPNAYVRSSLRQATTDHYHDAVHTPTTNTTYTEYLFVPETNEQRQHLQKLFFETPFETTTQNSYDAQGNLQQKTLSASGTNPHTVDSRIIAYHYDAYGNRILEENLSNTPTRRTERVYDTEFHQFLAENIRHGELMSLSTQYEVDYGVAFGRVILQTDENGHRQHWDYDALGRLQGLRAETEEGLQVLAEYFYDSTSQTPQKETPFPLSVKTLQYSGASTGNLETRVFVDGLGRRLHTVHKGANNTYIKSGLIVYDAVGRVTRQSQPDWATSTEIDHFILHTTEKNPTQTVYDPIGRIDQVKLPKAFPEELPVSITTTYPNTWETLVTHSVGQSKRTTKNARGQVLYVVDQGTGEDGLLLEAQIGFCYDIMGNRIKKRDLHAASMDCDISGIASKDLSGSNQAYWEYDAFSQLRRSSDPDLGTASYEYNAFGELIEQSDALGRETQFQYDVLGRITRKIFPDDGDEIFYEYDTLSGASNTKGRLVAVENGEQRQEWSYDSLGRRVRETRYFKNLNNSALDLPYTSHARYDLLDHLISMDSPENPITGQALRTCYTYNSLEAIQSITTSFQSHGDTCDTSPKTIIADVQYNEFEQMTQMSYGNGVTTHYTYDIRQRLQQTRSLNSNQDVLQAVEYHFSTKDNITAITNTADDYHVHYDYHYDGLNRLIDAQGNYLSGGQNTEQFHRSYAYALNGNLQRKRIHHPADGTLADQWDYTYTNHAVTSITSTAYGNERFAMQYDAVGNMVAQDDFQEGFSKTIEYDSLNRITKVFKGPDLVGHYGYDDSGARIRKFSHYEEGSNTTEIEMIHPSMYFSIGAEGDTWDVVNHIYFNGMRIAAMVPSGEALYYFADQVDSVKITTDEVGEIVTRTEFLPYGEVWQHEGSEGHSPKFNSQEYDKESRFYFYNARYYDPQIARFVTADQVIDGLFDTQGWNRFSYVKGNPIAYKDPSGNTKCENESSSCVDGESLEEPGLYHVQLNPETGKWEITARVQGVYTEHAAINGMVNDLDRATELMGRHVQSAFGSEVTEFTLFHNPTEGWVQDLIESTQDKLGFTTDIAKQFAEVLDDIQKRDTSKVIAVKEDGHVKFKNLFPASVKWIAHSQGGIIFSEAVRHHQANGGEKLTRTSVRFHAGGNNEFVTNSILEDAGVTNLGYNNHPYDPVPNIAGLNTLNPLKIVRSLIELPWVIWGDETQGPHALPYEGDKVETQ